MLEQHTVLPTFSSFIPSKRYIQLQNNLINGSVNTSSLRSGINASLLNWPKNYQICPLCWVDDQQKLGYNYWRRHFQCPGVTCCWQHSCYLIDSGIPLNSIHRHRFVGTEQVELGVRYTEAAKPRDVLLAQNISQLFNSSLKIQSWTNFYRYLAEYKNLMHGKRIDHHKISTTISAYWGKQWLMHVGLYSNNGSDWLLSMFRKHRRPFSYLHHLVVWQAMFSQPEELSLFLKKAQTLSGENIEKQVYPEPTNQVKLFTTRRHWLRLLYVGKSLKRMRSKKLGARLYNWLYRYDNVWLQQHKPATLTIYKNTRVDWQVKWSSHFGHGFIVFPIPIFRFIRGQSTVI